LFHFEKLSPQGRPGNHPTREIQRVLTSECAGSAPTPPETREDLKDQEEEENERTGRAID
jgi:hypothetical protein